MMWVVACPYSFKILPFRYCVRFLIRICLFVPYVLFFKLYFIYTHASMFYVWPLLRWPACYVVLYQTMKKTHQTRLVSPHHPYLLPNLQQRLSRIIKVWCDARIWAVFDFFWCGLMICITFGGLRISLLLSLNTRAYVLKEANLRLLPEYMISLYSSPLS